MNMSILLYYIIVYIKRMKICEDPTFFSDFSCAVRFFVVPFVETWLACFFIMPTFEKNCCGRDE